MQRFIMDVVLAFSSEKTTKKEKGRKHFFKCREREEHNQTNRTINRATSK